MPFKASGDRRAAARRTGGRRPDLLAAGAEPRGVAEIDPRGSRVTGPRFISGLKLEGKARVLKISTTTAWRGRVMTETWPYGAVMGGGQEAVFNPSPVARHLALLL